MVDVVGLRFVTVGEQEAVAAAQRYQRATASTAQAMRVVATASGQQKTALDRLIRTAQTTERQIQRLAQAQVQQRVTGAQATAELNRMAARLRALGMDRAQAEVMRYARASFEAARTTTVHTQAVAAQNPVLAANAAAHTFASRSMNASGMAMQQVGYQVGDFLVQVQSGTNAFVAFGQQATQLVGILPMFGSVMGISGTALVSLAAGLGIAIPLATALGAAFMRTRANAEDAASGIETLADRIRSAQGDMARMALEIEMFNRGLRDTAELSFVQGIEEAQARIQALRTELEGLNARQIARRGLGDVAAELEAETERLALLQDQLDEYRAQREESERIADEAERLERALETVSDMDLPFTARVRALAHMLGVAADEAARLLNNIPVGITYGDPNALLGMNSAQLLFGGMEGDIPEARTPRAGRGGGGGGGADPFRARVDGVREMQTAIEAASREAALYRQEVQLLDTALSSGLITQSRYNELLAQAQAAYGQAVEDAYDYLAALEQVNSRAMSAVEDALVSMVDGSRSAADAFRNMAQTILAEAHRMMVVRPLIQSLFGAGSAAGGFLGQLFPNAAGNAFAGGSVIPFANGGVVGGPTTFAMSGGRTGLMGEAGPEAIMPLRRGRDGKLGVAAEGGGPTFVMNYSFTGGVTEADLARAVPAIVETTKKSVLDMVQRGGSTARVFKG